MMNREMQIFTACVIIVHSMQTNSVLSFSSSIELFPRKYNQRVCSPSTITSLAYYNLGQSEISMITLDAETRRQQRLERLEKHSQSNAERSSKARRNEILTMEKEDFILGPDFMFDANQHNSILSDSPAVLLNSSAGSGKTTVLAGRCAHLLESKKINPQNMILLSFTKKDAASLKEKALDILYESACNNIESRDVMEMKLWSGTIHSFAINILQKYSSNTFPLRIISTREMRNRIRQCLGRINTSSKERMIMYKDALVDARQSINALVQHILRCLELWKEAGILPSPYVNSIHFTNSVKDKPKVSKDDFVELAMRLGIPETIATLALEISGDYQTLHASMGSSDPADVATIAYEYLKSNPKVLHNIRSKLYQIILDEYQDVSVSQHKLLRLIITGRDNEIQEESFSKLPVLLKEREIKTQRKDLVCYHVPKLCAAGDPNQSIYGWRGAAPILTIDGFRKDFPQGIVVHLNTSYRLPRNILNAANVLLGRRNSTNTAIEQPYEPEGMCFATSPAAIKSKKALALLQIDDGVINESKSSVFVQGLWDLREEAKFIASEIRRRSKERIDVCAKAFRELSQTKQELYNSEKLFDSSDVAIMVRSKNEMELFEEALKAHGIPFITSEGKSSKSLCETCQQSKKQFSLMPMKPCKLITMHQAKGGEFDDVYLASWTEGNFPHPSSVQTNRLHEERRIAYVALTRARQRVTITYSFTKRTAYFGPKGERKDVTKQVEPSQFLFDIMHDSSTASEGIGHGEGVEWSKAVGFKELIAGRDLPSHYSTSYRIPNGYRSNKATIKSKRHTTDEQIKETTVATVTTEGVKEESQHEVFETLQVGLNSIFNRERGSCKKYKPIFREILSKFGVKRGRAIVLTKESRKARANNIHALDKASKGDLSYRPLSKCTAEQLGLYVAYLLHKENKY